MSDVGRLLRSLPAIDRLLANPAWAALPHVPRHLQRDACRVAVDGLRAEVLAGRADLPSPEAIVALALAQAEQSRRPVLQPVVNATGVVLHTNLGRAPLAQVALDAIASSAGRYANLELDLETGKRGSRHEHLADSFARLLGCGDVVVTNNNAAAVFLALGALAADGAVAISRGELVEIGGSFRMPDIMEASGARMLEVGTTNRTHLADYERALDAGARVLLKVHRSNFDLVGFTAEVGITELAELAHARGARLVYDLGSGLLRSRPHLDDGCVADALAQGADLVLFSGDKLLGGPQAGVAAGRPEVVDRLRNHPVMRLVRPGKLTLLALEATLRAWEAEPDGAPVPVAVLCDRPLKELHAEATALAKQLRSALGDRAEVRVVPVDSTTGGGSSARITLPSHAVSVRPPRGEEELAASLRHGDPAVIGRLEDGALLLDVRALLDGDAERIVAAFGRWTS